MFVPYLVLPGETLTPAAPIRPRATGVVREGSRYRVGESSDRPDHVDGSVPHARRHNDLCVIYNTCDNVCYNYFIPTAIVGRTEIGTQHLPDMGRVRLVSTIEV